MSRLAILLAILLSPGLTQAANAHLHIKVTGTDHHNKWFLCLPNEGCMSLHMAAQGKHFPLTPGRIQQAFLLNAHNLRIYAQSLPESCLAEVRNDQTLHITGQINTQNTPKIDRINCKITI